MGDRNRTDMTSLEGWGFTTKLHPHRGSPAIAITSAAKATAAGCSTSFPKDNHAATDTRSALLPASDAPMAKSAPGVAAGICGLLFLRFPITRANHQATIEELGRRLLAATTGTAGDDVECDTAVELRRGDQEVAHLSGDVVDLAIMKGLEALPQLAE